MVCAVSASGVPGLIPGLLNNQSIATVQAQPAAADKLKAAQDAFDNAQVAYLANDFEKAAAGFQEAYAAKPFPQFLYNVGAAFHMKGKKSSDVPSYEKAIEFYKRYLSEDPTAPDKARVEKAVGVIQGEIKRIKEAGVPIANGSGSGSGSGSAPTPPPGPSQEMQSLGDVKVRGLVVIESEPANATIYLDDKKNGALNSTPWSGTLEGEHKLIIEKRGYKIVETRLSADPSKLLVIKAVMAEDDYLGWVEIKSNVPGADIFLDDKTVGAIGKTPFSGNFKPGKHTLWISSDGYDEYKQEFEVIAGETAEIKAQLSGDPVVSSMSVVTASKTQPFTSTAKCCANGDHASRACAKVRTKSACGVMVISPTRAASPSVPKPKPPSKLAWPKSRAEPTPWLPTYSPVRSSAVARTSACGQTASAMNSKKTSPPARRRWIAPTHA